MVEVSAVKVGYRALEIRELGFRDEIDTTPVSTRFNTPPRLEPGASVKHRFAYEEVVKKLDTFTTVFAEDTRRRSYSVDMDTREKERILYGPLLKQLPTTVRS